MVAAMAGETRLRIAIVTHYFPPEVGAAPSRLIELAQRLQQAGHSVTVLTGFPNYPNGVIPKPYRGHVRMDDNVGGVRTLRGWILPAANRGFARRVINHLSLTVAVALNAWRVGAVDVAFVQSPPLFSGLAGLLFRRLRRVPYVFNVSDIWPESAIQMGALRNRTAIRMAEFVERSLYKKAARVTVATPGMLERLAARGTPRGKLVLLRNGVDTETYRPGPSDPKLGEQFRIAPDQKVFLYAGNHGMAQGLGVILDAAERTARSDVLFLMVGDGADKERLVAQAQRRGLQNVRFEASIPKESMPALLSLAYATIIPLRRLDLFKSALPSKMFEAMAAGRPIVGALWGEAADLIETARCGIVVEPEDPQALSEAVTRLAADPTGAEQLGRNGREYVVANLDRRQIAGTLEQLLNEVARGSRAPKFDTSFKDA